MAEKQLKVLMYPWLAMGHITPYFELAKKFTERGHKVTLLLPKKAILKLDSSNLNPSLLTLYTVTIPHVEPLPIDTQLNSEIPFHLETHLATAFDLVRSVFESVLVSLEPDLVFYDFAFWVPQLVAATRPQTKCVTFFPICALALALGAIPLREPPKGREVLEGDTCVTPVPPGFPISNIFLDFKSMGFVYKPFGEGVTLFERTITAIKGSNAIAIWTCREIEGKFCDYLSSQHNYKPVLVPGLLLPTHEDTELDNRWAEWLDRFGPGSVVYCAFGSQTVLDVAQFQEILLGFEMTKLPFFIAFKPPTGCSTVEEAYPDGFMDRVRNRGLVTGDWVQQRQILAHPSIGCVVSHCGSGSIWESLLSKNQIVLMPNLPDQELFTKFLTEELKVGVKAGKSKESLYNAIKSVMDEDSEIGNLARKNHENLRQKINQPGVMDTYFDDFIKDLQVLIIQ
ncbi:unnamed protein product [Amaranthus hypochondriacus]